MGPRRLRVEPTRYQYLRTMHRGRSFVRSPRLRWGLIALALAVYTANFVGGDRGLIRREQLKNELEQIDLATARLTLEKERLLHEVRLEENDQFSLEKLAREKFWLAGPDEVIYRFDDDEVLPESVVDLEPENEVAEEPEEDEGP